MKTSKENLTTTQTTDARPLIETQVQRILAALEKSLLNWINVDRYLPLQLDITHPVFGEVV